MKGKLITIESGSDASGKATQTAMLYERLRKEGKNIKKIEFPNYESDSSIFVRMYLNGKFGQDPQSVDPYIVSPMFTLDRYCSYLDLWGDFYNTGGLVIADRYATSNMVHQGSKIANPDDKDRFLDWLWELEYGIYALPIPDLVIFLDVPPEISQRLMQRRANKFTGGAKKDIHESNYEYLEKTYLNALYIAEKYGWQRIRCLDDNNNELLPADIIHERVYQIVSALIE
jgi:dTMP kinase